TLLCNESGSYVSYESDEHGFNNPRGLWTQGSVKIVALGDSFTHGYCVADDKNFIALVRRVHPGTVNLGMAGDGPLLMLATFREYVRVVKPRVVLWFYFEGNDLADLVHERTSTILTRYLEDGFSQNLIDRQIEIDKALSDDIGRQEAVSTQLRKMRESTRY